MDAVAYKNGKKNQWRRTAWNAIERLVDNPRDAIVLYLPGTTDLDRPEALRRNFRPGNLIAIERDMDVCSHLRAKGTTTVCDTLVNALIGWPAEPRIAVVLADFQCGISTEPKALAWLLARHPALSGAVAVVNLQRGRDPEANQLKCWGGWQGGHGIDEAALMRVTQAKNAELNRAAMFHYLIVKAFSETGRPQKYGELFDAIHADILRAVSDGAPLNAVRALQAELDSALANQTVTVVPLPSYRSTERAPLFDSLCVKMPSDTIDRIEERMGLGGVAKPTIRAALAVRTRRLRGELRA